jgi:hypothetical protein
VGLALGVVAFGTAGLSSTLAQVEDDRVAVSGAGTLDESFIEGVLAEIFGEVFGGVSTNDEGAVSGGDVNVGGSVGSQITMGGSGGGSTGGGISIGRGGTE